MSAIDEAIRVQRPTALGRRRAALVVAALVFGLTAGFGLGRASGRGEAIVVPAVPALNVVGNQGPGHVPRHWVVKSAQACSPPGSKPFRCMETG